MRTLVIATLSVFTIFAHAQSYTTGMIIRLMNSDGTTYSQEGFHQAEVGFICDNGYMNFYTNDVKMLKIDSAMSMRRSYSNQQQCLDKQAIIQNTSSSYKLMVVLDRNANVADLRFCPMQTADEECFANSFNLQAR